MKSLLVLFFPLLLNSAEDLRFRYSFKQGQDTSCGVAVTASLLNMYWNIPVVEEELYQNMVYNNVENNGPDYLVSFLTISECLKKYGVASRAYQMTWEALADSLDKNFAPIVINYDKPLAHFVLLLHFQNNFAYVADPASGFALISKEEFEKKYSGFALVTASNNQQKNTEFIKQSITVECKRFANLRSISSRGGRL